MDFAISPPPQAQSTNNPQTKIPSSVGLFILIPPNTVLGNAVRDDLQVIRPWVKHWSLAGEELLRWAGSPRCIHTVPVIGTEACTFYNVDNAAAIRMHRKNVEGPISKLCDVD